MMARGDIGDQTFPEELGLILLEKPTDFKYDFKQKKASGF
jgi:hypothetical protein